MIDFANFTISGDMYGDAIVQCQTCWDTQYFDGTLDIVFHYVANHECRSKP